MDSYFEILNSIKEESKRRKVRKCFKETQHAIITQMMMFSRNLCKSISIDTLINQIRNENLMRVKRINSSKGS